MPLEFADVREHWDMVKVGLESISQETQSDWRLEDVYASLVQGQSHLLIDTSRTKTGFTVVESVRIPFQNADKLLIWIAYDPEPESALNYAEELDALARKTGHKQIEFLTPHPKLWSLGEKFGYQLRWAVLNKVL